MTSSNVSSENPATISFNAFVQLLSKCKDGNVVYTTSVSISVTSLYGMLFRYMNTKPFADSFPVPIDLNVEKSKRNSTRFTFKSSSIDLPKLNGVILDGNMTSYVTINPETSKTVIIIKDIVSKKAADNNVPEL